MLVASEIRGELARIHPARACCRRAELAGLLFTTGDDAVLRTLDPAIARTAVHLASSLGVPVDAPSGDRRGPGRHHLRVTLDPAAVAGWRWAEAPIHDRRAFLRGVVLGSGSISFGRGGAHVELVLRGPDDAEALRDHLAELEVRALVAERRGTHVVYLKGHEEIAALLRLLGANRGLLELETARVQREVRSRLNRLLNAEEANLGRTVRAADRQLRAIDALERAGLLDRLTRPLREAADMRRRQPEADLDTLATGLGVSRSAANHRLRRLVELAAELGPDERETT